jgi:hypothetical protein
MEKKNITKCDMCGQRLFFKSTISSLKKTCGMETSNSDLRAHKQNFDYTFYFNRDPAPENFQEDLSLTVATTSASQTMSTPCDGDGNVTSVTTCVSKQAFLPPHLKN